jgi:hypothetical protein
MPKYYRILSFVELLVVLLILASVSGVILSRFDLTGALFGPNQKTLAELVTESNMQKVVQVLMGPKGYYQDMAFSPDRMAHTLQDLFVLPPYLLPPFDTFDPFTEMGWDGPYLTSIEHYGVLVGMTYQFRPSFDASYGNAGDFALLDGWGNPLILQIEFDGVLGVSAQECMYSRLISAGPNGVIDTPKDLANMIPGADLLTTLTLAECGDDRLIFLKTSDDRE